MNKTTKYHFILGAPDPEMEMIKKLIIEHGHDVIYATRNGARVRPHEMYQADNCCIDVITVECDGPNIQARIKIDHHSPGDYGYGMPPEQYLKASSIGQIFGLLCMEKSKAGSGYYKYSLDCAQLLVYVVPDDGGIDRTDTYDVPQDLRFCAAADHCLTAAYAGKCPGVDPNDLMIWRAQSRAVFQKRSVEDILADVKAAMTALEDNARVNNVSFFGTYFSVCNGCGEKVIADEYDESWDYCLCPPVADMRGSKIPELPEAASRLGICFVSDGLRTPDGRMKVVCQSGTPEQIKAFMTIWAPKQGIMDIYGDPQRGFAGGYITKP